MKVVEYRSKKQIFSPSICLDGIWHITADKDYERSYSFVKANYPLPSDALPQKDKDIIVALRTVSGEGLLQIKNKNITLTKDTLIFFYINQPRLYHTVSAPWNFVWCEFMVNYRFFELDTVYSIPFENERKFFKEAIEKIEAEGLRDNYLSSRFATQLIKWMQHVKSNPDNDSNRNRVDRVMNYISQHYSDKELTCDELAAHVNVSERYLRKIFSELTGESPNLYLNSYRLQVARSMLETSTLPVKDIADSVGFLSQAYFCSCFKARHKVSPSAYRNSHKTV